jgi:hypothetical protein
VAEVLIGAYALRFQGLITRNPGDFQRFFPNLNLLAAVASSGRATTRRRLERRGSFHEPADGHALSWLAAP